MKLLIFLTLLSFTNIFSYEILKYDKEIYGEYEDYVRNTFIQQLVNHDSINHDSVSYDKVIKRINDVNPKMPELQIRAYSVTDMGVIGINPVFKEIYISIHSKSDRSIRVNNRLYFDDLNHLLFINEYRGLTHYYNYKIAKSLNLNSYFFERISFGSVGGMGGEIKKYLQTITYIKNKNIQKLTDLFSSPNIEMMTYGYLGLRVLQAKGEDLDEMLTKKLELFQQNDPMVLYQYGCVVGPRKPLSTFIDREFEFYFEHYD